MNTGKQFEADFKTSVPSDAWCYRLKDSAATYYGGNENLSFSIDNICDFLVYRYPMNHLFELKTIETPSIPLEKVFGKYDKAKCKYRKEKHITDMVDAMGYSGQTAHVIVNYRAVNRTFAIPASKVLAFRYNENRKSIPWQWAEQEGIEVKAKRLRVHWRYDVDALLRRLEKKMQLSEKQELVRLLGLYQSELLMENEENLRKKMRSNESPKKVVTDYSYGVKAQYEHARIIIKKLSVEIGKELKASWELW